MINPKQRQRWETIRSKGLARYLFVYRILRKTCIILAGYILANVLWRFFFTYSEGGVFNNALFWIFLSIIAFVYGIIYALVSWARNEEDFNQER